MNWHHLILSVMCCTSIVAAAQENAQFNLSQPKERHDNPVLNTPIKPSWTTPPTTLGNMDPITPELDLNGSMSDSLQLYNVGTLKGEVMQSKPKYDFRMDPYSGNWYRGGAMAMPGGGYLVGSGSYQAMPALGNIGSASLQWVQPLGDRLTVSAGFTGNKYHFDRDAWNSYAFSANARYSITDHFAVKAWGNYYFNQQFHSMATMPYLGSSNYGASVEMMANEHVGLNLGAQRYYDPFSRRWHTVPVIAPIVNVLGQPLSIDFGGLLGNLFESWSSKSRHNEPIDPMKSYDPKSGVNKMNAAPPVPPGFNPHSPVRIPDALRR